MRFTVLLLFTIFFISVNAQDVPNPRPLKMEEYEKAKTLSIKNLDEETYAKFENAYILDRYEMRKPYFVTGDDGLKKRIDLYSFIAKDGMQQLGILIFYTNEKNVVYKALLPNFTAEAKVWEKYFEDIHAIDKAEKNFVLKLTYITSKELGFQIYKSLNEGKDLTKESATYGNDICFTGDQLVTLRDGTTKHLANIQRGDEIVTVDAATKNEQIITVEDLVEHDAKNYAITHLSLFHATETTSSLGKELTLSSKVLKATPNHPMNTSDGQKTMGQISMGDKVLCFNERSGKYDYYEVYDTREIAQGLQKVYNITGSTNAPFVVNGVMVRQK
jgi:hypothetical protein